MILSEFFIFPIIIISFLLFTKSHSARILSKGMDLINEYQKRIDELREIEKNSDDKNSSEYKNAVANRQDLEKKFGDFKEQIATETGETIVAINKKYDGEITDNRIDAANAEKDAEIDIEKQKLAEKKRLRDEYFKEFE